MIPIIGLHLSDAIREGRVEVRAGLSGLTGATARFADGTEAPVDDVILATEFTASVACSGVRSGSTRAASPDGESGVGTDRARLLFVGHTYDAGGGLVNIRRDAPLAADPRRNAGRPPMSVDR